MNQIITISREFGSGGRELGRRLSEHLGCAYCDQESVRAAMACLEGENTVGDSLYFLAPELTDNHWTMENRPYVTPIGAHWFYL